ncbi:DNA polymerase III chi subunit [Thiogranum longum]|uniref:DNA polymerase III chi subunit n=1 Tax=Thiogranum longum TaxID=1537524 RepID=A0A4R1HHW7_9GAMM|nr:DNA polymerase III subunit chi [Thiogranum longum]TCK19009.1 DNA polymerase III chi subunit [Thiogranum longum]
MTQVDFYVLGDSAARSRLQFACRLADKAYRLGHRVYIHTESPEQTQELDTLLWTFQQNSFVPHSTTQDAGDTKPSVLLSHDTEPEASQVMINLAADVPLFFSRFERVAELINADNTVRQQGRSRYSFYKARGYPLRTHEIKS